MQTEQSKMWYEHKRKPLDDLLGFIEYLQLIWPDGEAEGTVDLRCVHWMFDEELVRLALAAKQPQSYHASLNQLVWDITEFFTIADALLNGTNVD